MCRSIIRLRDGAEPFDRTAMEAASLQFVRKVSGFREPSRANRDVFDRAVVEIAGAVERLMNDLTVRTR